MEKIEKIRAEIERLKKEHLGSPESVLNDIESFIESMEQESVNEDLGEATYQYTHRQEFEYIRQNPFTSVENAFKAGAEWMAGQGEIDTIEGEVCGLVRDHINIKFPDDVGQLLTPKGISHIPADVSKYNVGDKVIVTIRKK